MGLISFIFGLLGTAIFKIHKESGNLVPTIIGFAWLAPLFSTFEQGGFDSAISIGGFIGFAIGLLWGLKIKWDQKKGQ